MVRRVGGTIHNYVPATADIVRTVNANHQHGSSTPRNNTQQNDGSSSSSMASSHTPSPLHEKDLPKTVSPRGTKHFVHQNSLPSMALTPAINVAPPGTKHLVHQNSLPTIVPTKPTKHGLRKSIQMFDSSAKEPTIVMQKGNQKSIPSFASPRPSTKPSLAVLNKKSIEPFAPSKSIGTNEGTPSRKDEAATCSRNNIPSKPTLPKGQDPDLKFGAKPSEIRAAAKQNRDKAKVDQERKEIVRKREEAAALRMKKIKDEIDAIKHKEQESDREAVAEVDRERFDYNEAILAAKALESGGGPKGVPSRETRGRERTKNDLNVVRKIEGDKPAQRPPSAPVRKRSTVEEEVAASRGTKELALEEMMAERSSANQKKEEEEQAARITGGKAMTEIDDLNMPMDELMEFKQTPPSKQQHLSISSAVLAAAPPPPMKTSLEATPTGKLRKVPSRRGVERTPSNRVPEMRRRANQRDLLFDDDDKHSNKNKTIQGNRLGNSATPSRPNSDKAASSNTALSERADNPASKHKSSMVAAREARDAAKVEDERRTNLAQKQELNKARAHFDKGHDLCWKGNDSAGALVDYRKALFTRESVLGKYHEETGRSYFWIGKSLTKLKDYDEALMAFSRAMRIFERVLVKSNKYNIWTVTAIESVFRQMDDPDVDFASYKERLERSIRHEQSGDQLRKKGKLAEAIVEYREAIDNLEEYHPDAADLYCKIAIILRQQGEFDRALEEYRYASEIYELSLGAEHPETVKTLNQLIEKKRLNQKSLALMEKLKLRN